MQVYAIAEGFLNQIWGQIQKVGVDQPAFDLTAVIAQNDSKMGILHWLHQTIIVDLSRSIISESAVVTIFD